MLMISRNQITWIQQIQLFNLAAFCGLTGRLSLEVCDTPCLCGKVHSVNGKASCAGRPMFMPQRFQLGQREMPQGLVPRRVTDVSEGCSCVIAKHGDIFLKVWT